MTTEPLEMPLPDDAIPDADFRALLTEYVDLENRRRITDDDLTAIKLRVAEIEPQLIEQFGLLGMERARLNGLTVYTRIDRHVNKKPEKEGVTTQMVCDALRAIGLGELVSDGYSAATLKSQVAEWIAAEVEIPPALAAVINVYEQKKLATLKRG